MITHAGKLWATVPLYHYGIQDKIPNMLKSIREGLSKFSYTYNNNSAVQIILSNYGSPLSQPPPVRVCG